MDGRCLCHSYTVLAIDDMLVLFCVHAAKKGDWYWDRICHGKWEVYWRAVRRSFPLLQEGASDLMQQCMSYDPSKRPTIDEVYNNPWLKEDQASQEAVEQELKARKEASRERKAQEKQKVRMAKGA